MSLINYRLRITLNDSRQIVGQLLAFDAHMNLVLADSQEYRKVKSRKAKARAAAASKSAKSGVQDEDEDDDDAAAASGAPDAVLEQKRTLGLLILRGENIVSMAIEAPPPTDDRKQATVSIPCFRLSSHPFQVALLSARCDCLQCCHCSAALPRTIYRSGFPTIDASFIDAFFLGTDATRPRQRRSYGPWNGPRSAPYGWCCTSNDGSTDAVRETTSRYARYAEYAWYAWYACRSSRNASGPSAGFPPAWLPRYAWRSSSWLPRASTRSVSSSSTSWVSVLCRRSDYRVYDRRANC